MSRLAMVLALALVPLAAQAQDGGTAVAAPLSDTEALRSELQAARK